MHFEYIYLGYLIFLTILSFGVYATDKFLAKKGKTRISEKTLLLLSAFGGCLGGFFAMLVVRHKTKHWQFWAVNLVAILLHGLALFYLLKPLF